MRALVDTGPAADQDAIAAATAIDDISITTTQRVGSMAVFGFFGFTDTDALAVVTTLELLQEGVVVAQATTLVETPAVDNLRCSGMVMAFIENVAVGQTFTLRITPAGTAVDVKINDCKLMCMALDAESAVVPNFVSP